jgi:hypothetical protein
MLGQARLFCGEDPSFSCSGLPIFPGEFSLSATRTAPSRPLIQLVPEQVVHFVKGCFTCPCSVIVRPSLNDGIERSYDFFLGLVSQPSDDLFHLSHLSLLAFFARFNDGFETQEFSIGSFS